MKFNSQWNLGKKMHKCPAASMTSWTSDHCSLKLGWRSKMRVTQQVVTSTSQESLHFMRSFSFQSPHSVRTCFIPFGISGYSGWSDRKFICWVIFWSPHMNHPSQSQACLPPGLRFIWDVSSASTAYAECPCELLTMIKAWYPGPWALSNPGMIFSTTWSGFFSHFQMTSHTKPPVLWRVHLSNIHHNSFHTPSLVLLPSTSQQSSISPLNDASVKTEKMTRLGVEPRPSWTYTSSSNQLSYQAQ